MLSSLIYITLTLLLPLRLTHHALKEKADPQQARLWSAYWAIYSIILFLKSYLGFLTYQPFELFLVLFQLWLYSEQYRGALFLTTILTTKIEKLGLKGHVDLLAERLAVLNIFEDKNAKQEDSKMRKVE